MKLDELREALKREAPVRAKPAPKRAKPKRLRCSKCRGPRERANLSDPDVAEIIREQAKTTKGPTEGPLAAYRCRACRIIWIAFERIPAPPMHSRCRSR